MKVVLLLFATALGYALFRPSIMEDPFDGNFQLSISDHWDYQSIDMECTIVRYYALPNQQGAFYQISVDNFEVEGKGWRFDIDTLPIRLSWEEARKFQADSLPLDAIKEALSPYPYQVLFAKEGHIFMKGQADTVKLPVRAEPIDSSHTRLFIDYYKNEDHPKESLPRPPVSERLRFLE